jgi:hypothetical protein
MPTIIRRKADNVVTNFAESASFGTGVLVFTKIGGGEVVAPKKTSSTHEIIDDVTLPTKYYEGMLTYDDGTWTILTDAVAQHNANLKVIRDRTGASDPEDIEVEL